MKLIKIPFFEIANFAHLFLAVHEHAFVVLGTAQHQYFSTATIQHIN